MRSIDTGFEMKRIDLPLSAAAAGAADDRPARVYIPDEKDDACDAQDFAADNMRDGFEDVEDATSRL